jgi:hypothetical protein
VITFFTVIWVKRIVDCRCLRSSLIELEFMFQGGMIMWIRFLLSCWYYCTSCKSTSIVLYLHSLDEGKATWITGKSIQRLVRFVFQAFEYSRQVNC